MKYIQTLIACLVLSVLSACSSLGSKNVEPRRLHVTLVGSNRLNPGVNGDSRPVQSCIYIVRVADWVPMGSNDSSCAGRDQDGSVLAASRHVIAPNQVLQFWIEVPRTGEIWLLADADYAQRPPNYAPLRVRIDGQEVIHLANDNQPHGRGTVGSVQIHPGSRNVIPGQVTFTADIRHQDEATLDRIGPALASRPVSTRRKNSGCKCN